MDAAINRLERKRIVGDYVRERLTAEIGQSRGSALALAKQTGFSAAHISNIKDGHRNVGDTFAMAMADYWGMTYSQMERLALERLAIAFRRGNEPGPIPLPVSEQQEPADRLPQLTAAVAECDDEFYPKSFLREYERVARKSPQDRPKAVWLADLEVKYWDWRQRSIHSKGRASIIGSESVIGSDNSLSHPSPGRAEEDHDGDVEPSSGPEGTPTASAEPTLHARTRVRGKAGRHEDRVPRQRRG